MKINIVHSFCIFENAHLKFNTAKTAKKNLAPALGRRAAFLARCLCGAECDLQKYSICTPSRAEHFVNLLVLTAVRQKPFPLPKVLVRNER